MDTMIYGQSISYEDQGSGPAVVLIHGCPLAGPTTIETLIGSGYRVIIPNLSAQTDKCFDPSRSAGALAVSLVRLLDYLGVGRAVFCTDIIGMDVLEYLLGHYPQRIAGSCQALSGEKSIKTEIRILEYLDRVRQRIPVSIPLRKVA